MQMDDAAFSEELSSTRGQVLRVLNSLVGVPDEVEDIAQEALAEAWDKRASFRGNASLATWVTSIATRKALDHLRKAKRWRAEAQVAYANLCAESEVLSGEVMAVASEPEFAFDVRRHIAYCFACVGRSLPPDEIAALVLRDVAGLSAREACNVLGVSDSVMRHRLSAARTSMSDQYEGLCALVNKQGICHQCKGLRQIVPPERAGGPPPEIPDLPTRCHIARSAPENAGMDALHAVFWARTAEIEARGEGDTRPLSGCGEDD